MAAVIEVVIVVTGAFLKILLIRLVSNRPNYRRISNNQVVGFYNRIV